MARVTVEDCLQKVDNRFSLVHLAAKRVQQLRDGAPDYVSCKNKEVVQALREVASGAVYPVSAEEAERKRAEAEERERRRLALAAAAIEAAGVHAQAVEGVAEMDLDDEDDEEDDEAEVVDLAEDFDPDIDA